MRTGRPKADLVLSEDERSQLHSFARSRSLPAALCSRARIVLSCADGEPNKSIAERLKLTKATAGKRRTRFIQRRIAGLYDDPHYVIHYAHCWGKSPDLWGDSPLT